MISFSKGSSVNDLIPQHLSSASYEDFEHVSYFQWVGARVFIAEADIQSAFKIMPLTFLTFWMISYFLLPPPSIFPLYVSCN